MARRKFSPGEWGETSVTMLGDGVWQARAWFVDVDGRGKAVRRRVETRAARHNLLSDLRERALRIAQGPTGVSTRASGDGATAAA